VNFVEQLLDGSAELTAIALNDNVDHIVKDDYRYKINIKLYFRI
jgi:hypothetical protein